MWIFICLIVGLFSTVFGFLIGWAFAIKFKTFFNFVNYLSGKPEWSTRVRDGNTDVVIYSGSINQAKAIARMHESIIVGHK